MMISHGDISENANIRQIRRRSLLSILKLGSTSRSHSVMTHTEAITLFHHQILHAQKLPGTLNVYIPAFLLSLLISEKVYNAS